MIRWLLLGALVWGQKWVADPYAAELPPVSLQVLEGHFRLQVSEGGVYRDTVGDFQKWIERIPWEEGQEWYPPTPFILSEPLTYRKRPVQHLYQYTWQIHRSGQRLRLWNSLPPHVLYPIPPAQGNARAADVQFASQSVLATGRWYKISTEKGGIYKITAQTLRALGIDPAAVNPKDFRLYGQRGGLLSQRNSDPQPDDLVEIPVYFPGDVDDRWDEQDAVYFWADEPDSWYLFSGQLLRPYFHLKNPYTDKCYYFITFDKGVGTRIQTQSPPSGSPTPRTQVMTLFFHEKELTNVLKSGRVWLGEMMSSASPTLNLTLPLPAMDSLYLRVQVAAISLNPSQFTISFLGNTLATIPVPPIPGPSDSYQARWGHASRALYNTPPNPSLTLAYTGGGQGYLDYIEIIGWHPLTWQGGQSTFYLPPGRVWQVQAQASEAPMLWDVTYSTYPLVVPTSPLSNGFEFRASGDTLRRYCMFKPESAYEVQPVGAVPNQNLHALQNIQFVIATTSAQASLARRFCELHPEAGSCAVVTLQELYNEFSGGRPDICALRNFLRMLYVRAVTPEDQPQHLLIIGAASYNFKEEGITLFPTYQSRESFYPPTSYGSDDFFVFLDADEGYWGEGGGAANYDPRDRAIQTHLLDMGVTRIPTYTLSDLEIYLQKVSDYLQNPSTTRDDWLQKIVFFSDYKDGGEHTRQAEQLAVQVAQNIPYLDITKIYLDRYPAQPRASGLTFPEAREALMAHLNQGAFIVHYVGHGNEYTLQGFDFFPIPLVKQLQNHHKYLFFVTATCEWGKWDAPSIRSGGIEVLFLPQRGAIGLLTSTRKVFSSLNFALSQNFYRELAEQIRPQRPLRLGELMQGTKNRSWGGGMHINTRSYAFLGDPYLPLGVPLYKVVITHLGAGAPSETQPDTLRPLRAVRLRGEIRDSLNSLISDFQGEVTIRVWDKSLTRYTLLNRTAFQAQEILLFSGRATVKDGVFELTFYLPVDVIPQPGAGRISIWAQATDGRTAAGAESRFIVCCPDTLPPQLSPPHIRLYINDTSWVSGSWTHPNPLLIAFLYDSLGINLSGLAVGRELKATLNDKEYFLSSYFKGKRDKPNEGVVEYRFSELPEGEYRLRLRAYNLAGQEGTAETS
ncbi:MAG: type IX secretion system sortase PorU, partial [Bacteroidia bacterium]|nr:type IX secretion system sortase PorU [Bacteroidia bacterium]MDW8133988.1 type IX secretion system sortase PorU [Bacteroidia bacterium]